MAKKTKSSRKKSPKASSPIRDAISKAFDRKNFTVYTFSRALEGKVSRTAVYRYFSDGATTNVATIEAMMDLLDLKIVSK